MIEFPVLRCYLWETIPICEILPIVAQLINESFYRTTLDRFQFLTRPVLLVELFVCIINDGMVILKSINYPLCIEKGS